MDSILDAMILYDAPDKKRICHAMKVYSFAKAIGQKEGLNSQEQKILDASSILHDIGIHQAERIYGRSNGKYQEEQGVIVAPSLLEGCGYTKEEIEQILFFIGHHHRYQTEGGKLLQILFEADFLVNAQEDSLSKEAILSAKEKIFRTKTGLEYLEKLFL